MTDEQGWDEANEHHDGIDVAENLDGSAFHIAEHLQAHPDELAQLVQDAHNAEDNRLSMVMASLNGVLHDRARILAGRPLSGSICKQAEPGPVHVCALPRAHAASPTDTKANQCPSNTARGNFRETGHQACA